MTDIATNIAQVQERIAQAAHRVNRNPNDILLVGAAKTVPAEKLREAVTAGVINLGHNKAQELLATAPEVPDAQWHFIGALQRNKVQAIAPYIYMWQSVDRLELAEEIAKHAPNAKVLLEVNIASESQKPGCPPQQAPYLVEGFLKLGLQVEGLMCVPPVERDPRPHFAELRHLAENLGLSQLSMGMSGDFEVAIEEGATIVRVGTAIFGPRSAAHADAAR